MAITFRYTQTRSGSAYKGLIYGSNRSVLKWFVFDKVVSKNPNLLSNNYTKKYEQKRAMNVIYKSLDIKGSLAQRLECSPMARKTWVQYQVESYQRLKKWYLMPPCLKLSIIRYGSRVKWSNPGKGVEPYPTPLCSKLSKREPSSHPRLWSPTFTYTDILLKSITQFILLINCIKKTTRNRMKDYSDTNMYIHTTDCQKFVYKYINMPFKSI